MYTTKLPDAASASRDTRDVAAIVYNSSLIVPAGDVLAHDDSSDEESVTGNPMATHGAVAVMLQPHPSSYAILGDAPASATDDAPAPATEASGEALKTNLERLIEFYRVHDPEFYDAMKAAINFEHEQPRACFRCSSDDVYNLVVIILVLLPMWFEYFFSAQAERRIPNDGAAAIFGIDSVLLNTGLTGLLIGALIKSLMVNLVSLIVKAYQAPTAIAKLSTIAEAADKNILPTAWSSKGRAVLGRVYAANPKRYYGEMAKPVASIALKALGVIAALCLSAILYQNSENTFFKALTVRAWLSVIFRASDYVNGLRVLNAATLVLNTPLYSGDYTRVISDAIDTDVRALDAGVMPPAYGAQIRKYLASFVATGGETPTALAKMHYIQAFTGQAQQRQLKAAVMAWLRAQAAALGDSTEITASFTREQEASLKGRCAEILAPIDSRAWFKGMALACLAISIVTSAYYCKGIVPLFRQAATNENLWPFIRAILSLFVNPGLPATETDYGALALAILSVGVFSIIHSKHGFEMFGRDYLVKTHLTEGVAAKARVIAEGATAAGLTVLSSMTAVAEAGTGGDEVAAAMGGVKGATVNAKGSRLPAKFIVDTGVSILGAALSGLRTVAGGAFNAATSIFSVCCRRGHASAEADAAGDTTPLTPGGTSYGTA